MDRFKQTKFENGIWDVICKEADAFPDKIIFTFGECDSTAGHAVSSMNPDKRGKAPIHKLNAAFDSFITSL